MTKQELIARQKQLKRSSILGSGGLLVVFFAVIFGNVFLGRFVDRVRPPIPVQVLYGIVIFAFLIGSVVFLNWSVKRRQRRFGMLCPACGETISGVLAHIAVATDRCGYCGSFLFSDTERSNQAMEPTANRPHA
jgi:hypothetical protein